MSIEFTLGEVMVVVSNEQPQEQIPVEPEADDQDQE